MVRKHSFVIKTLKIVGKCLVLNIRGLNIEMRYIAKEIKK